MSSGQQILRQLGVDIPGGGDKKEKASLMTSKSVAKKRAPPTWAEIVGEKTLTECDVRFEVNFPFELFEVCIIHEKFLCKKGQVCVINRFPEKCSEI